MLAVASLAERLCGGGALGSAFSTCAAKGFRFSCFCVRVQGKAAHAGLCFFSPGEGC